MNLIALVITFGVLAFITAVVMYAPVWVADVLVGGLYVFALYSIINCALTLRKIRKETDNA